MKPLNPNDFKMKIVKDLGRVAVGTQGAKNRKAIFECSLCSREFTSWVSGAKKSKQGRCRACSIITHDSSRSNLYTRWAGVKSRCTNPLEPAYVNYGGRGITMCAEWLDSFENFKEWSMANGFEEHLTIDRINNDGNYEPDNCQWVSRAVQASNTRRTKDIKCITQKPSGNYQAGITVDNKFNYLGTFPTQEGAMMAYDKYIDENGLSHPKLMTKKDSNGTK